MSTNDVPGAVAANNDVLAMGCWAETDDESLIFVQSVEGNRVIYSVFDVKNDIEYRDAMAEDDFKKTFSWDKSSTDKWTWHNRTPFPWNRVIKRGAMDGPRFPSADSLLTAAERVAKSLNLRGAKLKDDYSHMSDDARNRVDDIMGRIGRAVKELIK